MPQRISTAWDVLLTLLALGALVPVGRSLLTEKRESVRAIAGHIILNCVFTMSAGLILVWCPDAHPMVVLGAGGLLSSLGVAGVSRWARLYLGKKLGTSPVGGE